MARAPTVVIGFTGAATIRQADDIARQLKQALESSDRIEVDCSGLTEVDVAFIQLILAACKSAEAAGKVLSLSAPAGGALLEILTICGAQDGSRAQFWLEGRTA
ncbi:sulfate transporter/anti sigma-factor antagonist sTAs [Paramagnetospirillum caucaseum]|uniref:Sulfate transporter/anti sigma-factor antagonist sTAs n=1 Tax=Paramagnetospirillum caucaseum TaxID=1244869 RepID=M3AAN4_9PROT|nr:STAS domain-containing protein [Paramagnetospirillum caucaseum]EME69554.1 sulfate transporter/anti sigma-factor antagonist sTAs [Paramagnetospirillum caucaseum]